MYSKTQNTFTQFKIVNIYTQYKWTFPNYGLEYKKKYIGTNYVLKLNIICKNRSTFEYFKLYEN